MVSQENIQSTVIQPITEPISFFNKYKYIILIIIIIIISGLIYYYKIKSTQKQVNIKSPVNEYNILDVDGNLIKVKGEKYKTQQQGQQKKKRKIVEPKVEEIEELEESSENDNTTKFNLTKSEMDDLVEKLN